MKIKNKRCPGIEPCEEHQRKLGTTQNMFREEQHAVSYSIGSLKSYASRDSVITIHPSFSKKNLLCQIRMNALLTSQKKKRSYSFTNVQGLLKCVIYAYSLAYCCITRENARLEVIKLFALTKLKRCCALFFRVICQSYLIMI